MNKHFEWEYVKFDIYNPLDWFEFGTKSNGFNPYDYWRFGPYKLKRKWWT